jgi:hypothetical protein
MNSSSIMIQNVKTSDWLFMGMTAAYTFISPIIYQAGFLFILVLADFITAIWRIHACNECKFHIYGIWTSIRKMIAYTLVLLCGYILDKVFIEAAFGMMMFYKIFILIIAVGEFRSIVRNISLILGIDIWTKVVSAFGKKTVHEIIRDKRDEYEADQCACNKDCGCNKGNVAVE